MTDAPMNGQIIDIHGLAAGAIPEHFAMDPEHAFELGGRHYYTGNFPAAEECFLAVIEADRGHARAWSALGLVWQQTGHHDDALKCYLESLRLAPTDHDTVCNLGYLYDVMGHPEHARRFYERALELKPDHARAHANLAIAAMRAFDFRTAWEHYDARFTTMPKQSIMREYAHMPLWDGHPTKKLFVWGEQGVGDQILYATLLADLIERGQQFVCELDVRLLPAFKRSFPLAPFVAPSGAVKILPDPIDDCTAHIPIMSLAKFYRNSIEDFAAQPKRLLRADLDRQLRLGAMCAPGALRVGIAWRSFLGEFSIARQTIKSATLEDFEVSLGGRDDIQLVSLQYEKPGKTAVAEELATWAGKPIHVPPIDLFNDIDGALAVVSSCDCVVTTSNVTAHYAGALGVPTYLIYPRNYPPMPYWRPGDDGRSLWYPSVECITAPTWGECVQEVAARL